MIGSIPANRSIPFLYTSRLTTTMVTKSHKLGKTLKTYEDNSTEGSSGHFIAILFIHNFHHFLRAELHGTTLLHTTSLRQTYDTNCFV